MIVEGVEQDGNHGAVLVTLGNSDYLADAQLAAFAVLPLVPGQAASTGDGIHDIRAIPTADGFDVQWYPGANREETLTMRPDLELGPVDHQYFLAQYELSASRERNRSPFNEALFAGRHFPDSILLVARTNRIEVRTEVSIPERTRILIEELGISEEAANTVPPDE